MSPRTDAFHKLVSELGPAVDGASTVTHAVAGAGAPRVPLPPCMLLTHAIPARDDAGIGRD